MKLQKLVKEYLESIKHSVKTKTYLFYLQICEIYVARYSGDLISENLNNFILLLQEKLSYSTIKIIKSLINRSLKFACENGIINEKIQITIPLKKQIHEKNSSS